MSFFFRFKRNGGFCDLVKDGAFWYRSEIYPARLLDALGNEEPIPLPKVKGCAWLDLRAFKKSMIKSGWAQVEKSRDCTHYETGNRTIKRKVIT